jgi:ascorbate-specific PTS system EIIC-type component UlaA
MSSMMSKIKSVLQRNPIVTGLTAAVVGYMLLNQGTAALATTLPSLLFLLPCLLMMVVCMRHMSSGKCDKPKETNVGEKTLLTKANNH